MQCCFQNKRVRTKSWFEHLIQPRTRRHPFQTVEKQVYKFTGAKRSIKRAEKKEKKRRIEAGRGG